MYKELKQAIINWLMEHEHTWQRESTCREKFHPYIYDADGNYLIGGVIVSNFISAADKLIYGDDKMIKQIGDLRPIF